MTKDLNKKLVLGEGDEWMEILGWLFGGKN